MLRKGNDRVNARGKTNAEVLNYSLLVEYMKRFARHPPRQSTNSA